MQKRSSHTNNSVGGAREPSNMMQDSSMTSVGKLPDLT